METWKKVPFDEYSDIYLISNKGRLKNVKSDTIHAINLDRDGYPHYLLCNKGKRKAIKAHRLVALAFIPNPNGLPCVNHKDEVKTNNSVDNLEWCTVKYNNSYGTKITRIAKANRKPVVQIKEGEVIAIYESASEASSTTGANYSKIRMCCRGRRKTAGGYEWRNL